jgi:hypothetical protein
MGKGPYFIVLQSGAWHHYLLDIEGLLIKGTYIRLETLTIEGLSAKLLA